MRGGPRLRILSLLTGVELSAPEVARELDITEANASYPLRRLAAAGELEVAGTEKVRGGLAKKYRYVTPADAFRPSPLAPACSPTPRYGYRPRCWRRCTRS